MLCSDSTTEMMPSPLLGVWTSIGNLAGDQEVCVDTKVFSGRMAPFYAAMDTCS